MKKKILSLTAFLVFTLLSFAQTGVEYSIRVSLDTLKYEVYMRPNVNWPFPNNITGTGQVTIKVPSSENFQVTMLEQNTSFPGSGFWGNNARVNSPGEEPGFDYISFGYQGSYQYPYVPGQEVLLFRFNNPSGCNSALQLVDNYTDPFMPPNSQSANIGNSLVTFGSSTVDNGTGLSNAWFDNYLSDTICDPGPLPLDLLTISGKFENCKPVVSWITANEVNVGHFLIERSENGQDWSTAGIVSAVGNTETETSYSFRDENAGFEIYYRLKIVDIDGSFEYSDIIYLKADCISQNTIHEIFPVPTTDELNFTMVSSFDGEAKFLIIDALGRVIHSVNETVLKGFNKFSINTGFMANGIYFLQPIIDGNDNIKAEKFIKAEH